MPSTIRIFRFLLTPLPPPVADEEEETTARNSPALLSNPSDSNRAFDGKKPVTDPPQTEPKSIFLFSNHHTLFSCMRASRRRSYADFSPDAPMASGGFSFEGRIASAGPPLSLAGGGVGVRIGDVKTSTSQRLYLKDGLPRHNLLVQILLRERRRLTV